MVLFSLCTTLSWAILLLVTTKMVQSRGDDFDACLQERKLSRKETETEQEAVPIVSALRSSNPRSLQQQATYRANYSGQFLVVKDSSCQGPSPVLRIYCRGTIQVIETSDASIVCGDSQGVESSSWNQIDCINTCANDTACNKVYLSSSLDPNAFAQVQFECSGEELTDADAALEVLDGDDAVCATGGRYFHVARLGVSCPTESGVGREFSFENYYFDCWRGYALPVGDSPSNEHSCFTGQNCDEACLVDYTEISIQADFPHFRAECVESSVPIDPVPAPVSAPVAAVFSFSARFHAAWGLFFDGNDSSNCFGNSPTVTISCGNGAIIQRLQPIFDTVTCSKTSDSSMECTDSNTVNSINGFTGVIYDGDGPVLPSTEIEYPPDAAFCSSTSSEIPARHSVQLGVVCGRDTPGEEYDLFAQPYVECGEKNDKFSRVEGEVGQDGFRYTCSEIVTIPISTEASAVTIPLVSVSTTSAWEDKSQAGNCFLYEVLGPTTGPTSKPTAAPQTATSPQPSIRKSPEDPPVETKPRENPSTTTEVKQPSNGGVSIGAVVGGLLGGLAMVGIAVLVGLKLRSRPNPDDHKTFVPNPQEFEQQDQQTNTESGTGGDFHSDSYSGQHSSPATSRATQPTYSASASPESSHQAEPSGLSAPNTATQNRNAPSSQNSSSSSSPRPSNFVPAFKDQARSVQPLAVEQEQSEQEAVPIILAQPVDIATIDTRSSGESSRRRRQIEP